MEHELWTRLYALAFQLDTSRTGVFYWPSDIVGVYAWAVLHDRPVSWACDRRNWPVDHAFHNRLPSQSNMSRRLRSPAVERLLNQMSDYLGEDPLVWVKRIDAKPLPVGGHSKDQDAAWGRSVRGYARGYKFYAVWGEGPLPLVWGLAGMNVSEVEMAKQMAPHLEGSGYLVGDKIYDSNALYDLFHRHGHQLVAPRKKPHTGWGHRRHSPLRLRSEQLLATRFGKSLFRERVQIERCFGQLTSCAGGLAPLPAWVRGPRRVRLWVQLKLLIHAVRHPKTPTTTVLAAA